MPYGSGADWTGLVQEQGTTSVNFEARFLGSKSDVDFDVTSTQPPEVVAKNLRNAWNNFFPKEATIHDDAEGRPVIVAIKRLFLSPESMWVEGTQTGGKVQVPNGDPIEVVLGLSVKEVIVP